MDSEVNCQREWFKSRGSDVPLWNRQNLSIEETAAHKARRLQFYFACREKNYDKTKAF